MDLRRKLALVALSLAAAFVLAYAGAATSATVHPTPPAPGDHVALASVTDRFETVRLPTMAWHHPVVTFAWTYGGRAYSQTVGPANSTGALKAVRVYLAPSGKALVVVGGAVARPGGTGQNWLDALSMDVLPGFLTLGAISMLSARLRRPRGRRGHGADIVAAPVVLIARGAAGTDSDGAAKAA